MTGFNRLAFALLMVDPLAVAGPDGLLAVLTVPIYVMVSDNIVKTS